jgi:Peptidase family M28
LILITLFVGLLNTTSITAAQANENTYGSYDDAICIFSVIVCLNDQLPQLEESEESIDKGLIHSVINQVNSTILIDWIDNLSSFHSRHTKSAYIENVAYWLKSELQRICDGKVYLHNFTRIHQQVSYNLKNIICNQEGSAAHDNNNNNNNHLILILAHYDSRAQNINQTDARAPGADDNASGVAAVLELARILSQIDLNNNIQFVLFSGEEQGQWGSTAYVNYLQTHNTELDLVMNLDMIGYPAQGLHNVVVEYDQGNKVKTNDIYSKKVGQFIEQIALDYANLEASLHPLGKTDLIPLY